MKRTYDYTPATFMQKARDWYRLARSDSEHGFTVARYVALCFSIEFMLKAMICLDKANANEKTMKKYSHNLEITKQKALEVIGNANTCELIEKYFERYPELNTLDVIEIRYGRVGSSWSYQIDVLNNDLYPELLAAADKTAREEWTWYRDDR